MKINLKTLTNKIFSIEVDPDDTILMIKQKIEKEQGTAVVLQNLVFGGKNLADNIVVRDTDFKENTTVVFFVKKSKAPPPQEQPSQKSQAQTHPQLQTQPPPQPQPQIPPQSQQGGLLDSQDEGKVNSIISMGFERNMAVQALQAAFGDVNVAVEYCMNGIPDILGGGLMDRDFADDDGEDDDMDGEGEGEGEGDDDDDDDDDDGDDNEGQVPQNIKDLFDELKTHPQFEQVKTLVQSQPNLIQTIMQQLGATNPALGAAIANYPNEFIRVLSGDTAGAALGTGGGGGQPQQRGGNRGGGQVAAPLSTEDSANINHIIELTSASKGAATEAYLACNKSVEQAINLLFDS